MIETAVRHLNGGEPVRALVELLSDWESTRDPGLARRILRLGKLLGRGLEPFAGPEWAADWGAVAARGNPADVDRLIAALGPGRRRHVAKTTKLQFDRLRERPPDPRISRLVPLWGHRLRHVGTSSRTVWTAFFRLLEHTADPRMQTDLEALRDRARRQKESSRWPQYCEFEDYIIKRSVAVLGKLVEAIAVPDDLAPLDAALDTLEAAEPLSEDDLALKEDASVGALGAAVVEDPWDDGLIAVWADALLESGDDRGTFINLQLQREQAGLTKKDAATERRLLKANVHTWLGPLDPVVDPKTVRFRRGLPSAGWVRFSTPGQRELIQRPEWRSFEQLVSTPEHLVSAELSHVRRVGMRLVEGDRGEIRGPEGFWLETQPKSLPWNAFEELASHRRPLPFVAIEVNLPRGDPSRGQVRAVGDALALPELHTLHLHDTRGDYRRSVSPHGLLRLGPLRNLPLLQRVETIVIDNFYRPHTNLEGWFRHCRALKRLIVIANRNEVCDYVMDARGLHLTMSRIGKPDFLADWFRNDLAHAHSWMRDVVGRLPHRVASFTLRSRPLMEDETEILAAHFANVPSLTLPPPRKRR